MFSSFLCFLEISPETDYGLLSHEKIIRVPSLDDVLGVFRVPEKLFNSNFSTFLPHNVKIPVTESL